MKLPTKCDLNEKIYRPLHNDELESKLRQACRACLTIEKGKLLKLANQFLPVQNLKFLFNMFILLNVSCVTKVTASES